MADAGMYTITSDGIVCHAFHTEAEAADAFAAAVFPIAKADGVEIGAIISRDTNGYYVGGAYSDGARNQVSGVLDKGAYFQGTPSAFIHTHPDVGGFSGVDRGFSYKEAPDEGGIGGYTLGPNMSGDLVTAYGAKLNAYMVDANGMHSWSYSAYAAAQAKDQMAVLRLGDYVK